MIIDYWIIIDNLPCILVVQFDFASSPSQVRRDGAKSQVLLRDVLSHAPWRSIGRCILFVCLMEKSDINWRRYPLVI